jgi:hypothetical protein
MAGHDNRNVTINGATARCFFWLVMLAALAAQPAVRHTVEANTPVASMIAADLGFMPSDGLAGPDARYFTTGEHVVVGLDTGGGALTLVAAGQGGSTLSDTLRWRFEGASPDASMAARGQLPGVTHVIDTNDASQWRTDVPSYSRIVYAGLYPGIDHGVTGPNGSLQLDFEVAPGADPDRIAIAFEGATVSTAKAGELALALPHGTLRLSAPIAWQEAGGVRTPVSIAYRFTESGAVGFAVGAYDAAQPLFIDPVIDWAAWLSAGTITGGAPLVGEIVATDADSNYYIAGHTVWTGTPPRHRVFVAKYNAAGVRVQVTVIGNGRPAALDVDPSGHMYVAGVTSGGWFTAGPLVTAYGGGFEDGVVAKVDRDGRWLHYAQYVGGSGIDRVSGLVVGPDDDALLFGVTWSSDFTNYRDGAPHRPGIRGVSDVFYMRLAPTGEPKTAYVFGSLGRDDAFGMTIDHEGFVYVTGDVGHDSFPTTAGAYRERGLGSFAAKIPRVGEHEPVWATMLGRMNAFAIAVQPGTGIPYIAGSTLDYAFDTTPKAFRRYFTRPGPDGRILESHNGPFHECAESLPCFDSVVMKLSADATRLLYSTYLGDHRHDEAGGIAVDPAGRAYVTGYVEELRPGEWSAFPITADAFQRTHGGGGRDAYVAILNSTGSRVTFGSFFGGTGFDIGYAVRLGGPHMLLGGASLPGGVYLVRTSP